MFTCVYELMNYNLVLTILLREYRMSHNKISNDLLSFLLNLIIIKWRVMFEWLVNIYFNGGISIRNVARGFGWFWLFEGKIRKVEEAHAGVRLQD